MWYLTGDAYDATLQIVPGTAEEDLFLLNGFFGRHPVPFGALAVATSRDVDGSAPEKGK